MINDKEINLYISKIKALLPIHAKAEQQFVNNLQDNVLAFIDSQPDSSMEDVIEQFGEPLEVVHGYIESMDIEELINAITLRKILRRIVAIALIIAVIGLSIFGAFYYKGYQYYKNTVATEFETIVDND